MGVKARKTVRDNPSPATRELPLHKGASICELSVAEEQIVIGGLRAMVRGLVEDFNRAVGEAVLYFSECVGMWALFALNGKNKCDKCVATGYSTVEGLAALVERLQREDVV